MLTIESLSKYFGEFCVIDSLSLKVEDGSITSILAPSGAGKTTLLRIVSALDKATSGAVIIDGKLMTKPTPDVGFMFQEPSAFPWLTVKENLEFGLKLNSNRHKLRFRERFARIDELAEELNIRRLLNLYPAQLSGGQKQRVVIARTLLLQPRVILCDEPFSALDELTRNNLRELLLELHSHYSPTIVFITHSVEEALFLGNDLVICSGPPLQIVERRKIEFNRQRNQGLLDSSEFLSAKVSVKHVLSEST